MQHRELTPEQFNEFTQVMYDSVAKLINSMNPLEQEAGLSVIGTSKLLFLKSFRLLLVG